MTSEWGKVIGPTDEQWPEWAHGYYAAKQLNDVDWLVLIPLVPIDDVPRARLCKATVQGLGEHWCYDDVWLGFRGLICFPPIEPFGWTRHCYWNAEGTWVEEHPPRS